MEQKRIKIAIIGCGSRGAEAYGRIMFSEKEKFDIVALCEKDKVQLEKYGKSFEVKKENLFLDDKEFFKEKRADAIVIATMDNDHVWQCETALKLGYDILLEKPITSSEEECERLLETHKKYPQKIMVCHVLRYAPAYIKLKEILDSETCGKIVMIDSLEQVCYWHQAHSFVRGNWRNSTTSSSMILQKCCHDFDLLQFYASSKCKSIASIGDLRFFKQANKPKGAADRCLDCKYVKSCEYSAYNIYIEHWKEANSPENCWPYTVLTTKLPLTEEAILKGVEKSDYGKCVFECDNNVVDNQIVMATMDNGITLNHRMTAFTAGGGRIYKFYCTHGQIELDEAQNKLFIRRFDKPEEIIDTESLVESGHNHGGGDNGLIESFYLMLNSSISPFTSLEASIESHLMAITAEKSRLQGGKILKVHS